MNKPEIITVTKKYNLNTPSWGELLNNFENSVLNNERIISDYPGFFASPSAFKILKVQNVLEDLKLNSAHLYFNITSQSQTLGKHDDPVDVWFWQVKGKSRWVIEDTQEYTLEKGDLIYIPKGTFHSVTPLGPRAGISMSYE